MAPADIMRVESQAASAELLVERFAGAEVVGLDTSPAMLAEARRRVPAARFADAGEMRSALDSLSQVRSTGHAAPALGLPSALAARIS